MPKGKPKKKTDFKSEIAIRRGRSTDLDDLCVLEDRSFRGDRISRRQMRHHLSAPGSRVWVCEDAGGRVCAYLLGFFHRRRMPRLYSVAVDAACRGQGLGSRLIDAFLDYAHTRRTTAAGLEVRKDARAVIALYERHGFKKVKNLPAYYEDGCDGWKMMVKIG